jgi:hypothetical protein
MFAGARYPIDVEISPPTVAQAKQAVAYARRIRDLVLARVLTLNDEAES